MDTDTRSLEIEDYEEGYELGFEIAELREEIKSLRDERLLMESKDAERQKLLSYVRSEFPNRLPSDQELELCLRQYGLKQERERDPEAIILPVQKDAPYAVWVKGGVISEQFGIGLGEDCVAFENVDTHRVLQECIPENTRRAYRGDIRYIGAWLAASGKDFWEPLNERWVERFVIEHVIGPQDQKSEGVEARLLLHKFKGRSGPHSLDTVKRRLAALSNYCKSKGWDNPVRSESVRVLVRQLSKKYSVSKQPKAIMRNTLIHMMTQTADDVTGARDRALLAFMFASGGRRRVEAEEAMIEDLEDKGDCFLFHMRRSKTNQSGKSEPKPITGDANIYLREWLAILGEKEGPLFRPVLKNQTIKPVPLKGVFISRIVKKLAERAGHNPKEFSAHSIRSGFVSQAAREGCSMPEVKALTGHKTDAMVSRYYQQGDVLRSKAGNLL